MEQKIRVLGVKGFKGEVEGKRYDSCKVRLEMPVPSRSETEVGNNVVEASYGDFAQFEHLRKLKWPAMCVCEVEMTTRGVEVLSIRPVEAGK
jgi:hypothetical protein